ncbi:MAG: class I SAM-dependent methyltransferase [Sphingomonadales bacterium]|nr:class I SAM-dependent methyltransferase [Sphingomonadales bacterium]
MAELLIHSMKHFAPLVRDALAIAGVRHVAEIGAEFGGMTQVLADHCHAAGGTLTSIDPAPQPEFIAWLGANPFVRHLAATSLEAMSGEFGPDMSGIDAWVIDGDHNHYTVLNELRLADSAGRRDGKPLLAFLHDVGWPCARRDFYYAPERIPAAFRKPCSHDAGVTLGDPGFLPGRGFRGHGGFAWALYEGGPGNGVLTAIEDFIAETNSDTRELAYASIPGVFGLGVLFDLAAPWAGPMAELLVPWHENELLATLEENRLRNYLTVIDWQDRREAGEI